MTERNLRGNSKLGKLLKKYLNRFLMLAGVMPDISFPGTEDSPSGFLPELNRTELKLKLQGAIYLHLEMGK